ncbi:MAG: hypothetical protein KKA26_02645 [Nanoarchaeota archaeon]|nr:hypothetical protein [Nanoarchaeota archaeon]
MENKMKYDNTPQLMTHYVCYSERIRRGIINGAKTLAGGLVLYAALFLAGKAAVDKSNENYRTAEQFVAEASVIPLEGYNSALGLRSALEQERARGL